MTVCLVYRVVDLHAPVEVERKKGEVYVAGHVKTRIGIWPNQTQLWKICTDEDVAKKWTAIHDDTHGTKTEWIYENREVREAP